MWRLVKIPPRDSNEVIFFTDIGLSKNENKEIDELIKEIEINSFYKIKNSSLNDFFAWKRNITIASAFLNFEWFTNLSI